MARQATQTVPAAAGAPNRAPEPAGVGRSPHLDASLDKAHKFAVGQHHHNVATEHLLFTLTEDPEALVVLGASTIDIDRLRADIMSHLAQLPNDAPASKSILPTADLLKVLKLAAMAAQQSARRQIDGAIVLAAVIGDASTPSAGLLRAHGLTFNEVIRVLQKAAPVAAPAANESVTEAVPVVPAAAPSPTEPVAPNAVAPVARAADASTDELLASVRARLQQAAPPPVTRRTETAAPAPAEDVPAVKAIVAAALPNEVTKPDQGAEAPVAAASPTPVTVAAALKETASHSLPTSAQVPTSPDQLQARPTVPAQIPPPLPVAAGPVIASPTPVAAPRGMPPPLPMTVQPPPQPATLSSALQQAHPKQPMPAPAGAPPATQPAANREQQRPAPPPPVPPVGVDMRALMNAMPRQLRSGHSEVIEVTIPRRALEIPLTAGHRWPPLRVAMVRLKAPGDDAYVELLSPEALWISPPRVHQSADDATWRWRVTPRRSGTIRLTLAGAARIVGGEGISTEIPFGEESTEIPAARRRSRRGVVGLLLFGNLIALGLLAMVMSGRAAEIGRGLWGSAAGLWGG